MGLTWKCKTLVKPEVLKNSEVVKLANDYEKCNQILGGKEKLKVYLDNATTRLGELKGDEKKVADLKKELDEAKKVVNSFLPKEEYKREKWKPKNAAEREQYNKADDDMKAKRSAYDTAQTTLYNNKVQCFAGFDKLKADVECFGVKNLPEEFQKGLEEFQKDLEELYKKPISDIMVKVNDLKKEMDKFNSEAVLKALTDKAQKFVNEKLKVCLDQSALKNLTDELSKILTNETTFNEMKENGLTIEINEMGAKVYASNKGDGMMSLDDKSNRDVVEFKCNDKDTDGFAEAYITSKQDLMVFKKDVWPGWEGIPGLPNVQELDAAIKKVQGNSWRKRIRNALSRSFKKPLYVFVKY